MDAETERPRGAEAVRVLHVTDSDLPGRRFNGYDLLATLGDRGIQAKQAVLQKLSDDPAVTALADGLEARVLHQSVSAAEKAGSANGLLFPWARVLAETTEFEDADVVHYHLIHNGVISLYDLGWLFEAKPSVWTFHDPWPLTGHCIHPMGCNGWLEGCHPCPFLDRPFAIADDHADRTWAVKKQVYSGLDVDIVVASEWMLDMVRRSPLTDHFERVHLVPFGIHADSFRHVDGKIANRRRLGIPTDDFVVLVRANPWEVKGLAHAVAALSARPPIRKTSILSLDQRGLLHQLDDHYRVVELGWVDESVGISRALAACDVLLMPSLAEAFGLLAVEAMAAGRPVVCYEGTALPSVTHAPGCGVAVPMGDTEALRGALDRLASDPEELENRGRIGREIVAREYDADRYVDALVALYDAALSRRLRRPLAHQSVPDQGAMAESGG